MNTVSKNIFWLSASRTLSLVFLFFAYSQLLRYLGPVQYGQYQFVLSFVLLFSTVVDFGIQQFITKKISEEPSKAKKYFHSFLTFEILVALSLYIVLLSTAFFGHYEKTVLIAITVTGLGMVANALTYPFLAVMTAAQDLKKVALINLINSCVNFTFIFLAIWFGKHIVFLASIQLVFGIIDLVIYRVFITKHIQKPEVFKTLTDYDLSIIKNILKSGWPFVLLVGFSAIYNRIDMVIITRLLGYEQTGYYGAAYKIFDLLAFFPAIVSHSLFPHFSSLMIQGSVIKVRENLEKYLRIMIVGAIPVAFGGTILSKQLIVLVAGDRYVQAAPILSILVWAPAILSIYIPLNSLVISQLTKKALVVTGVNVFVNVIGNLIFIPYFGLKAAAYMTVFSELLQGTFYFYFIRTSITGFRFFSLLWKPLLSGLIMGFVLFSVSLSNVFAAIASGFCVYVLGLLVLGFFEEQDLLFAQSFFKKVV